MGEVTEPIFFIGVPRSGTTLLFEAFAMHTQLGWPSNYTEKFPTTPLLGLIMHFTNNRYAQLIGQKKQYNCVSLGNKLLPKPAEAYPFWNYYTNLDFATQYLIQETATENCKRQIKKAVNSILRWQGKSTFSAKLTGPSRIHFLKSIYPNAKFIHVIRDGRAVVHSMLNVQSWTTRNFLDEPWWKGGLTKTDLIEWHSSGNNPAILAAIQWKKIIEIAQQESAHCSNEHYMEIRYEDFIENPNHVLNDLYAWSGLPESNSASRHLEKLRMISNMNYKYKKDMTIEEIHSITKTMEPLLNNLGYV